MAEILRQDQFAELAARGIGRAHASAAPALDHPAKNRQPGLRRGYGHAVQRTVQPNQRETTQINCHPACLHGDAVGGGGTRQIRGQIIGARIRDDERQAGNRDARFNLRQRSHRRPRGAGWRQRSLRLPRQRRKKGQAKRRGRAENADENSCFATQIICRN